MVVTHRVSSTGLCSAEGEGAAGVDESAGVSETAGDVDGGGVAGVDAHPASIAAIIRQAKSMLNIFLFIIILLFF